MFVKLCTLALALPLVSALTLNPPATDLVTGGTATFSWSGTTQDPPTFSLLLVNTVFHNTFAIANNVVLANGQITIELPQVPPGGGYSLEAIAVNNVNTVYSQTGDFSIGDASSSTTPGSTTSTPVTTSSMTMTMSSATGTTPSATPTVPVSSASAATTPAGTTSAATSTPSTFSSSGAASFKLAGVAPAAALVLSAVAGAVMVF